MLLKMKDQIEVNISFLLPTAYVVRREGNVLTHVCPSFCPPQVICIRPGWGGGGTPAGGVTPPWVPPLLDLAGGGTPAGGGIPHLGWST